MKPTLALFGLAALAASLAIPAAAQQIQLHAQDLTMAAADLIPVPSRIANGVVSVRNAGSAAAGPSIVTVTCTNLGGGACAEGRGLAGYRDPAYPNALAIPVPALAAGHVHNHYLPFWDQLAWAPGQYQFTFQADAGGTVAETNEGNNGGVHIHVVP